MSQRQDFSDVSQRVGLALIASAGLVSALSTFSLLLFIGWNAFSAGEKLKPISRGLRTFTLSSLGWYVISLLLCDLLQGVAFSLNFRWAAEGLMVQGKVCQIQGIVSQIGDLGAAIWSTAIAFHTFWLLFLIKQPHRLAVLSVLISGWSILIFLTILGPTVVENPTRGSFYGLSGAWCWIGTGYGAERVIYLYVRILLFFGWVFSALGFSFIFYTLIYLRFSGFITYNDAGKFRVHFHRPSRSPLFPSPAPFPQDVRPSTPKLRDTGRFPWAKVTRNRSAASENSISNMVREPEYEYGMPGSNTQLKRVARRIMWYPLVYAVVVIPVAICRMGVLGGWQPPFGLLVFAGICFGSSGLSNTVLFLTTRKSFITQANIVPADGILVTTQKFTLRDHSTCNEREIQLTPIKFSSSQLVSPREMKGPVVLYGGPDRQDTDGDEEKVMIIDHDHKIEDKYPSSN